MMAANPPHHKDIMSEQKTESPCVERRVSTASLLCLLTKSVFSTSVFTHNCKADIISTHTNARAHTHTLIHNPTDPQHRPRRHFESVWIEENKWIKIKNRHLLQTMDPGFSPKTATIKVRGNGGSVDPLFQAARHWDFLFFWSFDDNMGLIYISEEIWGTMINNVQPHLQDVAAK